MRREKKKGTGDLLRMKKKRIYCTKFHRILKNTHGNELELTRCKEETLLNFRTQKALENRFEFKFIN